VFGLAWQVSHIAVYAIQGVVTFTARLAVGGGWSEADWGGQLPDASWLAEVGAMVLLQPVIRLWAQAKLIFRL
jgi:hypothetical protein